MGRVRPDRRGTSWYLFSGARTFLSAAVLGEDERVNPTAPGPWSVPADRNVRAPLNRCLLCAVSTFASKLRTEL